MPFTAAGGLCAVSFSELDLPISTADALSLLIQPRLNFTLVREGFNETVLGLLRPLIGNSKYRRGARMLEAPGTVDCSSLVKWFYAQLGVRLTRRSIQQFSETCVANGCGALALGDLLFMEGLGHNYFHRYDSTFTIGHVAIATGNGTVIHATSIGVVEENISNIFDERLVRGIRRVIADPNDFFVFRCNPYWEVESSDDIKWLIFQHIG